MNGQELDFTPPESFLKRVFLRDYDELSLFVLSSSLVISFLMNQNLVADIKSVFNTGYIFSLFFFVALAGFGIVISFFHTFSKSKKDVIDKLILILFAISIQGFIAFMGIKFALVNNEISFVFPSLNGISAMITLLLFRQGVITHHNFLEKDVSLNESLFSLALLSILIITLSILTELHWIEILSLAILVGNQISSASHKISLKLFNHSS